MTQLAPEQNMILLEANRESRGQPIYFLDSSRGLASNQVHRIAVDKSNRLWLAGPVGLARYDGSSIAIWDRREGLECNGLRCVAVDAADRIWVGTDLGLDLLNASGNPVSAVATGTWQFGLCQHIEVSGDAPWIGAAQGLVKLARQPTGDAYRATYSADVGFVSDIKLFSEQRVVAASAGSGLVETDGQTWWRYRCEPLIDRQISRLAFGPRGTLLVGTDHGLHVIDDAKRTVIAQITIANLEPMVTAVATGADRIWIAFGRHLVAVTAANETPQLLEYYVLDSPVNDLLIDALGNIFVATNNSGLAMVSCLRHAIERVNVGRNGGVYSIKPVAHDQYAIGGEHLFGLTTITENQSSVALSAPDGLPDSIVWDSLHDFGGTWTATQNGLFFAPSGGVFSQVWADDPILGAPNRALLRRDEALWVGTLRGLACIEKEEVRAVNGGGTPLGYVYALHLDDTSALWIGTLGRGLWREQNGLEPINVGPLRRDGNTYSVQSGPDGKTLVIQDENVVLLERDLSWRLVLKLPPVAGWTSAWLDKDSVVIGASDGLRRIDLNAGRVTVHVQALLKKRDWEFTNSRALVLDRRGFLLCGLNSGLARVDLTSMMRMEPPICHMAQVIWSGVQPVGSHANTTTILPGRWSFKLRAFSAWFVDFESVGYQFQLVGFDDDWLPPQDQPVITYTSLPPGKYHLRCRAISTLAGNGPEATLLRVTVRRPLWAMGWTAALSGLDAMYDRLVRSRTRNKDMLERNLALERAVDERTSSLRIANQELIAVRDAYQKLSEIDELTQLGNRRHFEKEFGRAIALTRRLKLPLALLIVDIDHFKAVNDRLGHPVGDDYLRAVGRALAATIRQGEDLATRYGGEEFAISLVNNDAADALESAERIRAAIAALALPNAASANGRLTVSIGVAVSHPDQPTPRAEMVTRADHALYEAKKRGRNQVVVAD